MAILKQAFWDEFGFKKAHYRTYVETGSYRGQSIEDVINEYDVIHRTLSERFHQSAMDASFKALMNPDYPYPGDIAYAMLQTSHMVLTPQYPMCYQDSARATTILPLPALRELGESESMIQNKCFAAMKSGDLRVI